MDFNETDLAAAEQHQLVMRFEDQGNVDFKNRFYYKEMYRYHEAEEVEARIKADLLALHYWGRKRGNCMLILVMRKSEEIMTDHRPAYPLQLVNIYTELEILVQIDEDNSDEIIEFKLAFGNSS